MQASFEALALSQIECTLDEGVGWIRLNRAPANAIDLGLLRELAQAVGVARNDSRVRVVVLASKMQGFFCAGLDVKELEADEGRAEEIDQLFKDGVLRAMRGARKLFVALVNGHCLGGGLELALSADLRIGVQGKGKIGLPEVTLGGMPGAGGIQTLQRLIGPAKTLRMVALGEAIDAAKAHELGILDELHPDLDAAQAAVAALARRLAKAPASVGSIKLALYEGQDMALAEALVLERQLYRAILAGNDVKEGVAAFREKRAPRFSGS